MTTETWLRESAEAFAQWPQQLWTGQQCMECGEASDGCTCVTGLTPHKAVDVNYVLDSEGGDLTGVDLEFKVADPRAWLIARYGHPVTIRVQSGFQTIEVQATFDSGPVINRYVERMTDGIHIPYWVLMGEPDPDDPDRA